MHSGLHHMHVRKRIYRNLEAYPHPSLVKRWFDRCMFPFSAISMLTIAPQIYAIYVTHETTGLSLSSWILFTVTQIPWVVYGILHDDTMIFASSVGWFLLNLIVVIGIIVYST